MEVVDVYLTIQKIISQFGVEIIQSKRSVFLLDDYCAFSCIMETNNILSLLMK